MPQPTPAQMHVDRYLTNLSVAFVQESRNFVADKVFPIVPVAKQSDLYPLYDRGYFFRDEMRPRPLGGEAQKAGYKVVNQRYHAEEWALAHTIDDRVRSNADQPLNPDRAAMRLLTTQAMINRDRRWASAFFKTGVWTTDLTGVADDPSDGEFLQFNQEGSDPIGVVDLYKDAIAEQTGGYEPNVLVLGRKVYRTIRNHPDVIDRIKYTQRGVVDREILASLFGVDRVVVPGSVQNTAAEGDADNFSFIVSSNDMLLVYAAPEPALEQPSGGYIFAWTGLIPGETNAFGGIIQRMRDEKAHSDHVEIRVAYDIHLVAPDLGVFFTNCVGDNGGNGEGE